MSAKEQLERYLLKTRSVGGIALADVREYLTKEVILEASRTQNNWMRFILSRKQLAADGFYCFLHQVFAAADSLPGDLLLKFWFSCMEQELRIQYSVCVSGPADPLLADFPLCRRAIIKAKEPGWKLFRYLEPGGRRTRDEKLPDMLREAVDADSVPLFAIASDMMGKRISYSLINLLIREGKFQIFAHILKNWTVPRHVLSLEELCFYAVCVPDDDHSLPLLQIIEENRPGLIRDFRDPFGRNLLWYAMYNRKTIWFHPDSRLVPALLKYGCDPDNRNQIGLSWREVRDALPEKYKSTMIRQRHLGWYALRKQQPASVLKKTVKYGDSDALKQISRWDGMEVPGKKMSLMRVSRVTRGTPQTWSSLYPGIRKKIQDVLEELVLNGGHSPDRFLPKSWRTDAFASTQPPMPDWAKRFIADIPEKKAAIRYADEEEQAVAILRTGLLMYFPIVLKHFYSSENEFLRYFAYTAPCLPPLMIPDSTEEKMSDLIREDNLPEFAILFTMTGEKCSWNMLEKILKNKADRIRDWLLDETSVFPGQFAPEKLLFYAAGVMEEPDACRLVKAVEHRYPGICTRAKDCFGSNLLWYVLFNRNVHLENCFSNRLMVSFTTHSSANLVQELMDRGCRLESSNFFGITPKDVYELLRDRKTLRRSI